MFLNENDLFEIRLNTHWNFVDKFIVVEAGETHTGLKKPLKFDHARFEKYKEKIVYVSFDNFADEIQKYPELLDQVATANKGPYMASDDWTRDHFQFNYLFKVLQDLGAQDSDKVYLSCLDEIVKPEAIEIALQIFEDNGSLYGGLRPVIGFLLDLYAYKFNLLHKPWTEHCAGLITEVGNFKKMLPATIRERGIFTHSNIGNAGWHFTFIDPTDGERVLEKQRSWAHSRDVIPGQKTKFDHSTKEEALERFFHDYPVMQVEVSEQTHPRYIVDNLDNLQNFIYKN
jgi:beta-1,4-mannosyl-glycoprotein beta-1,4-N-acetylglucosaminyltransferase